MSSSTDDRRLPVTGASGFPGRHLRRRAWVAGSVSKLWRRPLVIGWSQGRAGPLDSRRVDAAGCDPGDLDQCPHCTAASFVEAHS